MVFHRAKYKWKPKRIVINNETLSEVKSLKYVCLIIDNKLKWIDHIAYTKNKISRGMNRHNTESKAFFNKKNLEWIYIMLLYIHICHIV